MGIGDGLIPDILDQGIYDDICVVSDEEAINEARALAREEGLLCGVSGGTNVVAARQLARQLGSGKTVVTLLPDTRANDIFPLNCLRINRRQTRHRISR